MREARQYSFLETNSGSRQAVLIRRERDGTLAKCLLEEEVKGILEELHDLHGHFSSQYLFRKCNGKWFWPTRRHDIEFHCRSCFQCQMVGPLRPTGNLLPILQLQPFDMLGIDFLGLISPIARGGARYVLVMVDYFTGFC